MHPGSRVKEEGRRQDEEGGCEIVGRKVVATLVVQQAIALTSLTSLMTINMMVFGTRSRCVLWMIFM